MEGRIENKMKLADRSICTGCGACAKACPKQAILFRNDEEGFPTPFIQADKCVECGLCSKVCPALNPAKSEPIRQAYAAQMLDRDALKDSTSGGLFTVLSREIFRRGGVVYGCVWDDQYNAVVRKEYDNLYLVDFFCGGSPSPYAFHEYLKTITCDVPLDKLDFKFRDKSKHGVGVHISYEGKNGRIHQSYVRNPYFFSYHTKVFHRKPCYHCQYRYLQRVEDLTIGDYWGVGRFHKEFDIRAGVSTLLVNSDKGEALLASIRDQLQLSPTRVEDIALGNNLTLGDKRVEFHAPAFRSAFFATIKTRGWTVAERKYLFNKLRLKLWLKQRMPDKAVSAIKKILRRRG